MSNMHVQRDNWLGSVLGRPAFKLVRSAGTDAGENGATISSFFGSEPTAGFYFAKIPTVDVATVRQLCEFGFRVVDVSVTFERKPASYKAGRGVAVRTVRSSDRKAIREIAETGFCYSRFHLDDRLPMVLANRIKREWMESYLQGKRGECVYVAELDDEPIAFLASLATEVQPQRCRVIDLIATHPNHRGKGAARSLVARFIADSSNYDLLRVGTQVANIPSIRLYESCGFRLAASEYVLHAHVGQAAQTSGDASGQLAGALV